MRLLLLAVAVPALVAASVPVQPARPLLDDEVRVARAEQAQAEAEARKLEAIAAKATGESERLAAQQAAAAQAIDASEARITAAAAELSLASARLAAFRRALDKAERPVAALLAGLAAMGQRPPILALVDRGGVDELVKTRILLDSTMPAIRDRSAALAARIASGLRIEQAAAIARASLTADRHDLVLRQRRLAALEQRAYSASLDAGGAALVAGDRVIAGRESLARIGAAASSSAIALAGELIAAGAAPARPGPGLHRNEGAPFAYDLPADARVTRGLAEIDQGGVRSRGLSLATSSGSPVAVSGNGILRFAGPFRDYDGVIIIDHGRGWISVIVNVATLHAPGTRLRRGEPLGRALGAIEVELSHEGRHLSPAIIAGSSDTLSNIGKGG